MTPRRPSPLYYISGLLGWLVEYTAKNPKTALWLFLAVMPLLGTGGAVTATRAYLRPSRGPDTALTQVVKDLKIQVGRVDSNVTGLKGKVDAVVIKSNRMTLALLGIRGGERAMKRVLDKEALDRGFRSAKTPFNPSTGFAEEQLSGHAFPFAGNP